MSLECPHCKSPIAREGQRFCYRCGQDLSSYYDSMSIRIKEVAPEKDQSPSPGATEVLGSETTANVGGEVETPPSKATLRVLLPTGDVFDKEVAGPEIQMGKGPRND